MAVGAGVFVAAGVGPEITVGMGTRITGVSIGALGVDTGASRVWAASRDVLFSSFDFYYVKTRVT